MKGEKRREGGRKEEIEAETGKIMEEAKMKGIAEREEGETLMGKL